MVIAWPCTEQTTSKRHPALVLDEPNANGDLQLFKVTSRSHHDPQLAVSVEDLAEGRIKKTSFISIDHRLVMHQDLVDPVGVRLGPRKLAELHRALVLKSTRHFSRLQHSSFRPAADPERQPWQKGSTIPYSGRVFTEEEVEAAVASTLDFGSLWAVRVRPSRRNWLRSLECATASW